MAEKKAKKTAVPLPGSKSKSKPAPTPSKLSNEFITDSDDSAAEETPSKAQKSSKKQKEPLSIAVHRPKTNGAAKKTEVPPPTKKSAAKKAVNKKPESSSSEESSDEATKEKAAPESESESEEDTSKAASKSSSSATSSVVSSDSEDSDDEETPAAAEKAPPKQSTSHTVEFVAAEPFVPPKGFAAVPTPLDTSSKATKMFENLDGKQIWHITAPAGVSLSQLKEFAMDKALAGGAILSQKGTDYAFSTGEQNEEGACEILVPRKNGYKAVPTRISRTLHLQQLLNIPDLPKELPEQDTGKAEFEDITKSSVKAPRPQLKGLRMRFFHSGFGEQEPGTLGMSDSEDEVAAPTQALKKPEKRRRSDAGAEAPTKKHKHRTAEEAKRREEKKAKRKEKTKATS